ESDPAREPLRRAVATGRVRAGREPVGRTPARRNARRAARAGALDGRAAGAHAGSRLVQPSPHDGADRTAAGPGPRARPGAWRARAPGRVNAGAARAPRPSAARLPRKPVVEVIERAERPALVIPDASA